MPNDIAPPPPQENPERVARAIRFALACLVLALCFLNIILTSALPKMREIFAGFGAALPAIVVLIFRAQFLLMATSWILPLATIGLLFSRPNSASFYALGIFALIAVAHTTLVLTVLVLPFTPMPEIMGTGGATSAP